MSVAGLPGSVKAREASPGGLIASLLLAWLTHRGHRWPGTANPHLIINQQTAMTTRAVSENWLTGSCRGLTATLERLRVDRQLEEALTCGADSLHLAAVFEPSWRSASMMRPILPSDMPSAVSPQAPGVTAPSLA